MVDRDGNKQLLSGIIGVGYDFYTVGNIDCRKIPIGGKFIFITKYSRRNRYIYLIIQDITYNLILL